MADIAGDGAVDPDAQAAVTDFLDYTEYLPADLIRSFTLIRGLDESYLDTTSTLDDLTKLYGSLPAITPAARPDPQELRSQISTHLDSALNARESAYAEACRLYDVVDRHQNRLKSILAKLNAIPKPPSRDPTPQPPTSPQIKRSRSGRKLEDGHSTRLTLHPPRGTTVASAILRKPRGRRVTVPGEVMPPYDPDSPIASTEVSDWESPPPSPPRQVLKLKQPKLPSAVYQRREKSSPEVDRLRDVRETTEPYRKPTPPPEDAALGSKYRPWTHLTEYEMYKLRKKMKKNLAWEPSDIMIRRELADRGRGWENYYRAKAEADANGTTFYDIDSIERSKPNLGKVGKVGKIEVPELKDTVEIVHAAHDSDDDENEETIVVPSAAPTPSQTPGPKNKASKKETKKEKKADPARSQAALAAQEAELAARRLSDIGSKFRNLFSTPFASALASLSRSTSTPNRTVTPAKKTLEKTSRKRKAEDTPASSDSPSAELDAARKKQKTLPKPSLLATSPTAAAPIMPSSEPSSTTAGTIKIPLKLTVSSAAAPASNMSTPAPPTRAGSVQRASVAPKRESTPPLPSRPPSRLSAAASVEPQPTRSSRRTSMTPSVAGRKTPAAEPSPRSTAASRRSKRDAPGTVTQSSQDGGAAVSVSKRKTKPVKNQKVAAKVNTTPAPADAGVNAAVLPQIRIDADGRQEIIDPDEERYCVCGDVSWGEMICCEMDEKCDFGQWFHMECISLAELPPRTVKWYCPGDRKKLHKGENSNGLVGRGIK
ncbi:hypothetical protein LTR10_019530 [Elasticomyces elasticus]|uniref:Inhibitor of growth protein N-terminal histone-binding domain-containing protein n=1 Tax=Exophiala sideris TaxID=1016849 RepID=A0ABR0J541_9EURO|nr:hypothetical protein LTR10_019530 [Elasticomyces elasticus]KAK5028495.1 hypothetical protein LTS07_006586 [Exophiala sideris]KAK5035863.1 hypothetical protein LTR13_005433 [Exophiala sideris]KAK5056899.1 hypothetical protein LTR69_007537 [Exophiala sideris]KAK5181306.1 hypothetical protein LTR44_006101 [Eurotiomycetes sp. CCFEE 6388]